MQRQADEKTVERPSLTKCPKCGAPAFDTVLFYRVSKSGCLTPRENPKVVDVFCKKCAWRGSDVKIPKGKLIVKLKK